MARLNSLFTAFLTIAASTQKLGINVNTQFRAYPFYKASEWMPHKKLLLNSIVF